MKCGNSCDTIHKDVVIVGNGPSGIALSYMLSGNIPKVISNTHPDELLSARLEPLVNQSLVQQDLGFLSSGLEGRTTNPVSLLLDNLIHPGADIGLEMDPLIEWRNEGPKEIIMNTCRKLVENVTFFKNLPLTLLVRIVSCLRYEIYLTNDVITKVGTPGDSMYFILNGTVAIYTKSGKEIEHIVLGKGPPGGSWHSMDPQILTLSLGSWMALPGLKYKSRNPSEKRAPAKHVAEYYEQYVKEMNLEENFRNHMVVTNIRPLVEENKNRWVEKVNKDVCPKIKFYTRPEPKEKCANKTKTCYLTNALNFLLSRGMNERCSKRIKDYKHKNISHEKKLHELLDDNSICYDNSRLMDSIKRDKEITLNFECDSDFPCDSIYNKYDKPKVPYLIKHCDQKQQAKWIVEVVDMKTRAVITYTCNHLVLANGSSDLPNKLSIPNYKTDPYWLMYDLKSLEIELDLYLENNCDPDPVLIIGAGLSAADAIIATRARNVPVLHAFRNKSANLNKQLPENMYPEYHKVHEMMKDGSNYPLYTALPEYALTDFDEISRKATLTSKEGKSIEIKLSYAAILIGSRPDLSFLPNTYNLATKKHLPIDCKKNTININKLTHQVNGVEGLYAIGPLAGDNFVRFLPGGALAILCDLYKKYNF